MRTKDIRDHHLVPGSIRPRVPNCRDAASPIDPGDYAAASPALILPRSPATVSVTRMMAPTSGVTIQTGK